MENFGPSQLQCLPLEILQEIAGFLDRRSLLLFSLASNFCRIAASRWLHRDILLRIADVVELESQIDRWEALLASTSSIQHVRCFKLMNNKVVGVGEDGATQQELHDRHDERPPSAVHEHDSEWLPLANFLRRLPGLVDVIYGHSNQLSPCVLSAILAKPGCRLHMQTFYLRSLCTDPPATPTVDPYEKTLATALCLHSITCRTADFTENGDADNNFYAIMDMVKGLAPRLSEVSVIRQSISGSIALDVGRQASRRPWEHTELGLNSGTFGKLTRLSLGHPLPKLREWSQHTDFSCLKTLELRAWVGERPDDIQTLQWLATSCRLVSLRTLAIKISLYDFPMPETLLFQAASASFFDSLPPLDSLTISGHYDHQFVEEALARCGSKLQHLALNNDQTEWKLAAKHREIASYCPALKRFSTRIPRTLGSATELAIYQSLGKEFRHLERLRLTLECEYPLDPDSLFMPSYRTEADVESVVERYLFFRTAHVRDVLLNFAVDEALARSIFAAISQARPREPGVQPLEYLELVTNAVAIRADELAMPRGLDDALKGIDRAWRCERNPRDDCEHECIVEEVNREQREWDSAKLGEDGADLDADVKPIFRSIWPGNGNWWEEWHSLPLNIGGYTQS